MVKKSKKSKKNQISKIYEECFNYIYDSRKFIYAGILIFIIFTIIPFIFPTSNQLEQILKDLIEKLIKETEGMNQFQLIKYIFMNNLFSSFFALFLGILFGFFSVGVAVVNGYVLGFVSNKVVNQQGITFLWRLLPHGIFELPAIFISIGLGIKLGTFIFQKDIPNSLKNYLFKSIKVFILVVIPLLIIAATIEGTLIYFVK